MYYANIYRFVGFGILFSSVSALATGDEAHLHGSTSIETQGSPMHQWAETFETEVKFLIPDLSLLPADVRQALENGTPHPLILRRGFVLEEYLPVNNHNLEHYLAVLKEAGIPFGTQQQQSEFLIPGRAMEIRMMSKSLKEGEETKVVYQATIKGAGGLSVNQLETPANLTPDQFEKLRRIFLALRPQAKSRVKKVCAEIFATDAEGQILRRSDRSPHVIELDMFIGPQGIEAGPSYINGEIEFHGETQEEAVAKAQLWQRDITHHPALFGMDLTEVKGVKSRDIAAGGVPEFVRQALVPYADTNRETFLLTALEYSRWSDPEISRLMMQNSSYAAGHFIETQTIGRHPLRMIDPQVFLPSDLEGMTRFFRANGYVVIDQISEKAHRDAAVALMDKIVESKIPKSMRLGFMDLYHDNSLAQLRQNPALYSAFVQIFGQENLWVVFDRVMYWHQNEGEKPLHPHVDQNPLKTPGFAYAQAMLALRDMHEGTGTLALVPRSHHFFQDYAQWTREGAGYIEHQGGRVLPFVGVRLKEGQIIIWDSRTTHSRFRGTPTATRYAALLTYTPAKDDPELIDIRMQALTNGTGVSNYDAGLRATAGRKERCEQSLRETPEELSELGRKLYGMDPWI